MKGPGGGGGGGGGEKNLEPQLWHACAGSMVQIPPLNSVVFYFPQGHLEHSQSQPQLDLVFPKSITTTNIPSMIPCRVSSIEYLADPETDEVYTKITLFPLPNNKPNPTHVLNLFDEFMEAEEKGVFGNGDDVEKPASFAKTLTQSDANNGGGFSVPRYCAETIFPRLDYRAEPPVQTIVAKDVHGEVWKFRHIYRGTPRRHLLTTGWSSFVNQKKLVAGDSIVFLRSNNGELRMGIRRAKPGIMGPEWVGGNGSCLKTFGGFWKEEETKRNLGLRGIAKGVRVEEVLDAARRAANGQPFEAVYYPRASTPEFFVKAASVREAMRIRWWPGMRFKMAFETEDSSRISWFMGTVASVQVSDPIHWPNSPWRLLQVTWDEPDLLQNVKRVSPWLVELVSNVPVIHMSPYSPPRKKLRLPQQSDIPLDGQFHLPLYSGKPSGPSSSPLCCLTDNTSAGIQGARHAQFGLSLSDLQLGNKLQSGLFLSGLQPFNPQSRIPKSFIAGRANSNEIVSCLLTMGNSNYANVEKPENVKKHQFLLFGQPILTEQQISRSHSADGVLHPISGKNSSNENKDGGKFSGILECASERLDQKLPSKRSPWAQNLFASETGMDIGHCKVFMGSEDLGQTLDLSLLGSYEELYRKLANMFGIERCKMLGCIFYRDTSGAVKRTGDEPFSLFRTTAKQVTILMNPPSNNDVGRTRITGIRNAESGSQGFGSFEQRRSFEHICLV